MTPNIHHANTHVKTALTECALMDTVTESSTTAVSTPPEGDMDTPGTKTALDPRNRAVLRADVDDLVLAASARPYWPRSGYPRLRLDRLGSRARKSLKAQVAAGYEPPPFPTDYQAPGNHGNGKAPRPKEEHLVLLPGFRNPIPVIDLSLTVGTGVPLLMDAYMRHDPVMAILPGAIAFSCVSGEMTKWRRWMPQWLRTRWTRQAIEYVPWVRKSTGRPGKPIGRLGDEPDLAILAAAELIAEGIAPRRRAAVEKALNEIAWQVDELMKLRIDRPEPTEDRQHRIAEIENLHAHLLDRLTALNELRHHTLAAKQFRESVSTTEPPPEFNYLHRPTPSAPVKPQAPEKLAPAPATPSAPAPPAQFNQPRISHTERIAHVQEVLDRLDREWLDYELHDTEAYYLTKPLLRDGNIPQTARYQNALFALREHTNILTSTSTDTQIAEAEHAAEEAIFAWGEANDHALAVGINDRRPAERAALRRLHKLVTQLAAPSTPAAMQPTLITAIEREIANLTTVPPSPRHVASVMPALEARRQYLALEQRPVNPRPDA